MKRSLIASLAAFAMLIGISATAAAQPRAVGIRVGATGFEASYEHNLGKNFVEAELGADFGSAGLPGFKVSSLYNIVFARPAWTDRGTWAMYAGPGLSLGYVSDRVHWNADIDGQKFRTYSIERGFMFSFAVQAGLEYTFWFPLQLSVDIRPYFGLHVSDRSWSGMNKTGFYNHGMLGFVPTISARYRF